MADCGADACGGCCTPYHSNHSSYHVLTFSIGLIIFSSLNTCCNTRESQARWFKKLIHHAIAQRRLGQMGVAIATPQLDVAVPAVIIHSTRTDLKSR